MRSLSLFALIAAIGACSRSGFEPKSCVGEACSGHGICGHAVYGEPMCACHPGYVNDGPLACHEDPSLHRDGSAGDAQTGDAGAQDLVSPVDSGVDAAIADMAFVDAAPADSAAPDTAAPDTAAPDTAAPDTIDPDSAGSMDASTSPDAYTGQCGDGMCTDGEICVSCADCATTAAVCGNGVCNAGEDSTTCLGDCGPDPWPTEWAATEGDILALVNVYRSSGITCPAGDAMPPVPELSPDSGLRAISRNEAWDYSHHNYDPGSAGRCSGDSIFDLMAAAGYTGPRGAANAWGYTTAQDVVTFWMANDVLCPMLMGSGYALLGMGMADDAGPPWYVAAIY